MTTTLTDLRPAIVPARRTTLPAIRVGVLPEPQAPPVVEVPPVTGKVQRVLVVDDNVQVRTAVTRFLRLHGFHVETASDGRSALAELRRQPVDFVLLDVDMPGMSGFEVCRRIKADPSNAFVPVIMLTALDSSEDRVKGAEAGADGYLGKPVPPAELVARVKAGVRQRELVMQAIRVACSAVSRSEPEAHVEPPMKVLAG